MKTTTAATATRWRRSPRTFKRPAYLDRIPHFLATSTTSCRAMLSFLARLSGRRRRWRHVRDSDRRSPTSGSGGSRPGAAAAGVCSPTAAAAAAFSRQTQVLASSSMAEADESSCARCRAHSSCSCELLGLHLQQQQQQDLEEPHGTHCRQSRYSSPPARRSYAHCAHTTASSEPSNVLLRRRPPERTSSYSCSSTSSSRATSAGSSSWRTSCLAATLLILSTGLISYTEACSSRSTPKPRPPTPTPRPNITFHMYTCPPDYAEWYCLNGATCFTVKIVDSLLYNCLCANGFIGQRCEFKDLDGSYLPSRQRIMLETASIAGAVTIAVFLAVITFISVYIHCKRKQKELRMMSNGNGVDVVDGLPRDPELRPFCSRSRSLMIFMAKNPNSSTTPPIEHTRMPNWNYQPSCPAEASTRMANVNENKRPSQ